MVKRIRTFSWSTGRCGRGRTPRGSPSRRGFQKSERSCGTGGRTSRWWLGLVLVRHKHPAAQQASEEPARPWLAALVAHVPDRLPGRAVLLHGRTPRLSPDPLAQRPMLQGVLDLLHDLPVHRLRRFSSHPNPIPIDDSTTPRLGYSAPTSSGCGARWAEGAPTQIDVLQSDPRDVLGRDAPLEPVWGHLPWLRTEGR